MTIIPTKKRMTSSDENSMTCSKSIVLVKRSIEVPIKAKLRRKSQKNNVPRIEAEKIVTERACREDISICIAINPTKQDKKSRMSNFRIILFIKKEKTSRPLKIDVRQED